MHTKRYLDFPITVHFNAEHQNTRSEMKFVKGRISYEKVLSLCLRMNIVLVHGEIQGMSTLSSQQNLRALKKHYFVCFQ